MADDDGQPGNDRHQGILDRQIDVARHLDGELTRTERNQMLTAGVLATAFSFAGSDAFLEYTGPTWLGISPLYFWLVGLVAVVIGVALWVGTFLSSTQLPISELHFGASSEGLGYQECVEQNETKLNEWEDDVNSYQRRLHIGLILIVAGLLLFLM